MENNEIRIVRTNSSNEGFIELTNLLDKELWGRYGEQQTIYDKNNQVEKLDTVLVAYLGGKAVACGCFRVFTTEQTVELKRMYVKDTHRGQGISKRILYELEQWAIENGFQSTVLETGILQHEAISLYQKQGYHQIKNYGDYGELNSSICFGKKLKI